jgi:hypothetical protein
MPVTVAEWSNEWTVLAVFEPTKTFRALHVAEKGRLARKADITAISEVII